MEDPTGQKKILSDLNKTVDQILISFEALEDWGPSGNRPDQYNSDVVADQVTADSLGELGYRIKLLLNLVIATGKHQQGGYLFMCLIVLIYKKIYEIPVFYWNGM